MHGPRRDLRPGRGLARIAISTQGARGASKTEAMDMLSCRKRNIARHVLGRSALAVALSAVTASARAEGGFTVQSVNAPFPEFVANGNSVPIVVRGPSSAALRNVSIRVNGTDVTDLFAPQGS